MATQHPDNASVPWWRDDAFIPTQDEIEELLLLFRDLPIDEYMWDWEGKYVDEAVGEKLFSRAKDFFVQRPLGDDLHLTFRIPAFDGEKMHRMARAFMNVLSLVDLAHDIDLPQPPVTEMFLPLTTSSEQPLQVRSAFRSVADYHKSVFHRAQDAAVLQTFQVTPLVEDVDSLFAISRIVRPYWTQLLKENVDLKRGVRIFLARSDPALNAGLVPAVLAMKAALSVTADIGAELGFAVHPVIGTGSLPFRGGVNPRSTDIFLDQYAGTRTYSIQSAFRYDYPREEVHRALEIIQERAPALRPQPVPGADLALLQDISGVFSSVWKPTIEAVAGLINTVAAYVPPRRERLQHIGLFGYSRGVGAVKLPRAIGFTAALYSIGLPPELLSTGRALRTIRARGQLATLQTYYPTIAQDMQRAGAYLNRENLQLLSKQAPVYAQIAEDVADIENVLGIELGPVTPDEMIHRNITSTIFHRLQGKHEGAAITRDIVDAALLRRSLG